MERPIIAQFHVNFRNSVSGTGIGMVSKAEQVQEQEWVRNAKKSGIGTFIEQEQLQE